ncbi:MAG: DUF349 domain-containing protein [Cyclobacteriaceae bacterium]
MNPLNIRDFSRFNSENKENKRVERIDIPFGFIQDGKIYLSSWSKYDNRQIGEVRDNDIESSVTYFQNRFNILEQKIVELEQKIASSNNKGSFLMKTQHLNDNLSRHDGVGNYEKLGQRLASLLRDIETSIVESRKKNTEIKKKLLSAIEPAVKEINWNDATLKVNDIRTQWIKTGNAITEEQENLEAQFWEHVNGFFDRKKEFYEDKKRLTDHYERIYREIIDEARKIDHGNPNLSKQQIADLKERWEDNGSIPSVQYKSLRHNFNKLINRTPRQENPTELKDLLKTLTKANRGEIMLSEPELKGAQKMLNTLRVRHPELKKLKYNAFEQLNELQEKNFVDQLCRRRFKGYEEKQVEEKIIIKRRLIKELLERDNQELAQYELNTEKLKSSNEEVNKLIARKIKYQQQKITIKLRLLEELKA